MLGILVLHERCAKSIKLLIYYNRDKESNLLIYFKKEVHIMITELNIYLALALAALLLGLATRLAISLYQSS